LILSLSKDLCRNASTKTMHLKMLVLSISLVLIVPTADAFSGFFVSPTLRKTDALALRGLQAACSKSTEVEYDPGCSRRELLIGASCSGALGTALLHPSAAASEIKAPPSNLVEITDPETYSALAYSPPTTQAQEEARVPLIVVLHGAGINSGTASDLADPKGEHAGLIPSLLASGNAPKELSERFAVLAPYSQGKTSFYEEPRTKLLKFVQWALSDAGRQAGCPVVDPSRVFLFGFSDGATVGVELLTTRKFRGGVFAAYGFTGELPKKARERLSDQPVWVFHSKDDVIFPVKCSDNLVKALRAAGTKDVVRYTRFDRDQEGFTGRVKGHSTGITASKDPEIYTWMLSL